MHKAFPGKFASQAVRFLLAFLLLACQFLSAGPVRALSPEELLITVRQEILQDEDSSIASGPGEAFTYKLIPQDGAPLPGGGPSYSFSLRGEGTHEIKDWAFPQAGLYSYALCWQARPGQAASYQVQPRCYYLKIQVKADKSGQKIYPIIKNSQGEKLGEIVFQIVRTPGGGEGWYPSPAPYIPGRKLVGELPATGQADPGPLACLSILAGLGLIAAGLKRGMR